MSDDVGGSASQARRQRSKAIVLTSPAKDDVVTVTTQGPLVSSSSSLQQREGDSVQHKLQRREAECAVLRGALCAVHARLLDLQHEQHLHADLAAFLTRNTCIVATQTEEDVSLYETISEMMKESKSLASTLLECVTEWQQHQHQGVSHNNEHNNLDEASTIALREAADHLRQTLQDASVKDKSKVDTRTRQHHYKQLLRAMKSVAQHMTATIDFVRSLSPPPSSKSVTGAASESAIEAMMREAAALAAQRTAALQSSTTAQATREATCRALQLKLKDCEEALQRERRTSAALRARVAELEAQLHVEDKKMIRQDVLSACERNNDGEPSLLITVDPSRRLFDGGSSTTALPSRPNSASANTRNRHDDKPAGQSSANTTMVDVSDIAATAEMKNNTSEMSGRVARARSGSNCSAGAQSERRNRRVPAPPLYFAADTVL